ncbi:MAG: hypothetical protein AB1405_12660 [Bdellovibrionota bacterium]
MSLPDLARILLAKARNDLNIAEVRHFNPFAVEYRYGEPFPEEDPMDRKAFLALALRCFEWAKGEVERSKK